MRAETSKPTASAVRSSTPARRSSSHTASAAGRTVLLACEPVSGSHSKAPNQHAVGEAGAGDVGAPALVDDRGLGRTAERPADRHNALGPGLTGAYERGAERVEDGDLEVLDEPPRQVGERGLGDEAGEHPRLVHGHVSLIHAARS